MDNYPSEKRELYQNQQQGYTSQPGYPPQQGNIQIQQGYPPQQGNVQIQQGYNPQQGTVQIQQGYNPQQGNVPVKYGYQQGYVQPIPVLAVNQTTPSIVVAPPKFGIAPVSLICINCKNPITTQVEESFNCCSCLICCWTGFVIYACIQACNGKEICCCDATHRCPKCGFMVGKYTSN